MTSFVNGPLCKHDTAFYTRCYLTLVNTIFDDKYTTSVFQFIHDGKQQQNIILHFIMLDIFSSVQCSNTLVYTFYVKIKNEYNLS